MKKLGIKIILSVRQDKVTRDLERFNEVLNFVEEALHVELKRRESYVFQKLNVIDDENEASLMAEFYAEDIFQIEIDFPRLQRYALFVSLMSIVESNLIGFCRTARRIFSVSKDFDGARPQVIKRSMEYLEKEVGINTSQFKYYIDLSINLNHIRNCLVHDEGSIKNRKDSEIISDFIKGKEIISLDSDRGEKIILNKGFVEFYSQELHKFLDCVSVGLGNKVSSLKLVD
jgi:hypothetical protein